MSVHVFNSLKSNGIQAEIGVPGNRAGSNDGLGGGGGGSRGLQVHDPTTITHMTFELAFDIHLNIMQVLNAQIVICACMSVCA